MYVCSCSVSEAKRWQTVTYYNQCLVTDPDDIHRGLHFDLGSKKLDMKRKLVCTIDGFDAEDNPITTYCKPHQFYTRGDGTSYVEYSPLYDVLDLGKKGPLRDKAFKNAFEANLKATAARVKAKANAEGEYEELVLSDARMHEKCQNIIDMAWAYQRGELQGLRKSMQGKIEEDDKADNIYYYEHTMCSATYEILPQLDC